MVFFAFHKHSVRYTTGANTFHHVKLMNHAIIISHCTILVGVKTECNFFFKALILFALQSSHFKILNIAFAHATNNRTMGCIKKPSTYPSIETSSLILYQLQVQQYAEMLLISKFWWISVTNYMYNETKQNSSNKSCQWLFLPIWEKFLIHKLYCSEEASV